MAMDAGVLHPFVHGEQSRQSVPGCDSELRSYPTAGGTTATYIRKQPQAACCACCVRKHLLSALAKALV